MANIVHWQQTSADDAFKKDDTSKKEPAPVSGIVTYQLQRDWFDAREKRDDLVRRAVARLTEMRPTEREAGDYCAAVEILDMFSAREGIEILSNRLLYAPNDYQPRPSTWPTYMRFPVTSALISIGPPAVPAMLRVIRNPERTEIERRIACWVLLNIEAGYEPGQEPEDPVVKEAVIQRLQRLQYSRDLKHPEGLAVEAATEFVHGFVETEFPWQELPEIQESSWLPDAQVGKQIRHRFTCKKPLLYPNAAIRFALSHDAMEKFGFKITEGGEFTGTFKEPGDYWITVLVTAEWKDEDGVAEARLGAKAFQLYVQPTE